MTTALLILAFVSGLLPAVGAIAACMLSSRISRAEEEAELRAHFGEAAE